VNRDAAKRAVALEHLADVDAGTDADAELRRFTLETLGCANGGHGAEEACHQPVAGAIDELSLRRQDEPGHVLVARQQVGPSLVAELARPRAAAGEGLAPARW